MVEVEEALEERILRVLYDGAVSARDCAARLDPYARPVANRILAVEALLRELAERAFLDVDVRPNEIRYSLTRAGSLRLAELVA